MAQVRAVLRDHSDSYCTNKSVVNEVFFISKLLAKTHPKCLGAIHHNDLEQGFGKVYLSDALDKKQPPTQIAGDLLKETVRVFEGLPGMETLAREQGLQFPGAYVV